MYSTDNSLMDGKIVNDHFNFGVTHFYDDLFEKKILLEEPFL